VKCSRLGDSGVSLLVYLIVRRCRQVPLRQRCAGRDLEVSESLIVNRGKVTDSRQRSNVRDFLLCPGPASYLLSTTTYRT
jgi:hypothetical protein